MKLRDAATRLRARLDFSGPTVAALFHRLLGLAFLDAWLSLAVQWRVLIGARGLLPVAHFLAHARAQLHWWEFPTLLWIHAGDTTLVLGITLGVLLSLTQIACRWPRTVAALQTALYLSYVVAGRDFFSFQWDNLILECAFFAIFLPRNRRAFFAHFIFRLILFKLYWESGVAKFQSHNHDWRLGTAMASYYETAPLPTALAWFAHHAPAWWHKLESWATLAFELGVPFAILGPRRVRLAAAGILTGFQLINIATANYGFFAYLAIALHVFLLDDNDLLRLWNRVRTRLRLSIVAQPTTVAIPQWRQTLRLTSALVAVFLFVSISTVDGLLNFVSSEGMDELLPLYHVYEPWHLVNSYHLFGQITTRRIEPELQTSDDGEHWTAHQLWHKPGDPRRRPDWVAPHQPRVDFQLWFYGLRPNAAPRYVETLIERLCHDPDAVQTLFRDRLPAHPKAARIAFWQYGFTSPAERRSDGAWWSRALLGTTDPVDCATVFPDPDAD